jgi:hypothetical protein
MRTFPLALIAVLALAAGGCGGSSSTSTTTGANPVASAPDATAPPTDATQPGTNPVTPPTKTKTTPQTTSIPQYSSTTSSGQLRTRMPADFVVRAGKLVPAGISGPAGIPVDVSAVSKDGEAHKLLIEVPPKARTLDVPVTGRVVLQLPGLHAGTYGIELDGQVAGGLVIGRPPGP